MIGQEQLLNKVLNYNINTLPKTTLFIGEIGSGRHSIIKLIANNLKLDIIEITNNVTAEQLFEYQSCPVDKIYLINISNFSEKQQSQFLKFIEEPGQNNFIMLIANSEARILETILNRCQKFYLQQYTENELRQIVNYDNDLIYKVCKTPGQLKQVDIASLSAMQELCNKIIEKAEFATYSNLLSISTNFNYGELYDKFDVAVFFNLLNLISYEYYCKDDNQLAFEIYKLTIDVISKLNNNFLNKEYLMLAFLDKIFNFIHKI